MFSVLPEDILQEINAHAPKPPSHFFLAIKHADLKAAGRDELVKRHGYKAVDYHG